MWGWNCKGKGYRNIEYIIKESFQNRVGNELPTLQKSTADTTVAQLKNGVWFAPYKKNGGASPTLQDFRDG